MWITASYLLFTFHNSRTPSDVLDFRLNATFLEVLLVKVFPSLLFSNNKLSSVASQYLQFRIVDLFDYLFSESPTGLRNSARQRPIWFYSLLLWLSWELSPKYSQFAALQAHRTIAFVIAVAMWLIITNALWAEVICATSVTKHLIASLYGTFPLAPQWAPFDMKAVLSAWFPATLCRVVPPLATFDGHVAGVSKQLILNYWDWLFDNRA